MTFNLRKKSFAALRSNAPPPIDTSPPPALPSPSAPVSPAPSTDDVFGPVEPIPSPLSAASAVPSPALSAGTTKMGKLFGWTKKSGSSPRVPQVDSWGGAVGVGAGLAPAGASASGSGGSSPRSRSHSPTAEVTRAAGSVSNVSLTGTPASSSSLRCLAATSTAPGEDLTSLGLFPSPPTSHPSLAGPPLTRRHTHKPSTASDYTIPRQHSSSAFTSPLLATSGSDPRTMSTFNSGSSFASTALFSDEWESGSEVTSQVASSPESGSGLAPRMWKVRAEERQSQASESPLRTEWRRSTSWDQQEGSGDDQPEPELGYLSYRNSTPVPPTFSLANLAEPTTPPRSKRCSTSTLKASPTSRPFDLQQEKAKVASERRAESSTPTPGEDVDAADDEMSPVRIGRQELAKLQQQLIRRQSTSGLLYASDVPYASSRIPSIRFEGISMDAVFAEVEKKMQSDEAQEGLVAAAAAAERKTRRRSRVLSQYKPLDYGAFTTSPPAHQGTFVSTDSVPSLAGSAASTTSLSTMATTSSAESFASFTSFTSFDRSATPTPTNTGAARPRPYPRRTSSRRPAPLDVAAANSLPAAERVSPNATPTNFASAITPTTISPDAVSELATVPVVSESIAVAQPSEPVAIPEFSFSPPSPTLDTKAEWTGLPPSPTVEHGPEPAPAPMMVASGIMSEEPLSFKTVETAPVVTKVTVLQQRPSVRISTRPAVKAPVRQRSNPSPVTPPTPPYSPSAFAAPSTRAGPGSPATPTNRAFSFPPVAGAAHQRAMSGGSECSEAEDALEAMLEKLNRPHTPPDDHTTPRAGDVVAFGSPLTHDALEQHSTPQGHYSGGWESGQESDDSDARFGDAPVQRRSRLMGPGVQYVGKMGMGPVVQIQPPSEVGSDRESSRHGRNYSGESFGATEEEDEEDGEDSWEDEADSVEEYGHGLGLEELEDEIEAQLASMAGAGAIAPSRPASGSYASHASDLSSEEEGVLTHVVGKTTGLGIGFGSGSLVQSDSCRSLASLASDYSLQAEGDGESHPSLNYLLGSPQSSPERAPSLHRQTSPLPRNYSPFGLSHSPSEDSLAELDFPSPPRKRGAAKAKPASPQQQLHARHAAPPVFTISSPPRRGRSPRVSHGYSSSSDSSASVGSMSSEGGYESMGEAVVMTGQRVSYAQFEVGVAM